MTTSKRPAEEIQEDPRNKAIKMGGAARGVRTKDEITTRPFRMDDGSMAGAMNMVT